MTAEVPESEAQASGSSGWPSVGELLRDKLRKAIAEALSDSEDMLDKIAKDGGNAASHGIIGDVGLLSDFLSTGILALIALDPPVGLAVETIKEAEGSGGKWSIIGAFAYMMGYTMFQSLMPLFEPMQHAIGNALQTEIFDPQTAAELQVKGIIGEQFGRSEAAGGNLAGDHYDKLVAAAQTRPPLAELLALLNRGVFDEGEVKANLTRLGYDAATQTALLNLKRNLLGGADLALGLLRQDITQEQAAAYAETIGISAEDLTILYNNTGEPPGPEQLLFLWRRGFIDQSRLERGIRQSRIRPEWIDAVENLRYVPMSTEEAIKASIENYLTKDQARAIADQNGLEADHFDPLWLSWGRPLAHGEMGSLVHRGLASRDQFNQAMRESDIKDKYIDQSFLTTQRLIPERLIVEGIKFGAIDMTEGASRLMALGYDQADTGLLLKLGLNQQASTAHALTRSQITTLYSDGILSRADAKTHLTGLGYSAQDSELMLQIVDTQNHAKEVKAEVDTVRFNYLADAVDKQTAENELTKLGESPAQAQHNVQLWDREKRRAAKTLSEGQIVKAGKAGTLSFDNALNLLVAMGYSRENAAILLNSNGVLIAPSTGGVGI